MKKLGTLFTLLCIMNLFALVGLLGYLFGTGRLDKQKATAIVAMIRHQGEPEKFNEKLYDILEPTPATNPATAPASQPAVADAADNASLGTSAQDRLQIANQAMQQERIRLDTLAQELRNRQELLAKTQEEVEAKLKKIEAEKGEFEKKLTAVNTKARDENFQKSLDLYNELKPKQVKDMFLGMTPELVSSYIQAMDSSRAGDIISEFKSPPEIDFIKSVLERIRTSGTSAASGSPSAGNSSAPAPGT
jgi:flagellar motility protein MotE (MotC chaperone)